jgi:hypothetical protein
LNYAESDIRWKSSQSSETYDGVGLIEHQEGGYSLLVTPVTVPACREDGRNGHPPFFAEKY